VSDRNLEVALRIKADMADAAKQVTKVDAALDKLSATGKGTASGLNATATAADKAASSLDKQAGAANAAAAAHGKLAPAVAQGAAAMRQGGLTAGQYSQAMRQLPLQVTDIVTGLASGQPVFLVAIQQGGQLRDAFGGVTPALRALAGLISPTVLAVGAGAVAFGLIGKAIYDSRQELENYERALISTGGQAGLTAGQVADLADRVGATTRAYGDAAAATLQLVQSGKFTAEALENASRAAVALARLTGESIEDTTGKIIKLAESPVAGLLKLNEQYHFLTLAQYENVRALEEQGRGTEALAEGVRILADRHEARVREMEERASGLGRAWRAVRDSFAEARDAFGRAVRDDADSRLRAAQQGLEVAQRDQGPLGQRRIEQARAELAAAQAVVDAEHEKARIQAETQAKDDAAIAKSAQDKKDREKAERDWDSLRRANLDKQEKLEQEIADIRATGLAAKKDERDIDAQIAAARQRYADSLPKARASTGTGTGTGTSDADRAEAAAQRELANLEKQVALLGAVEDGQKRASEEARVRYEIDQGGLAAASAGTQQQLIEQAKLLDAKRAEQQAEQDRRREFEKTQQAYESLRATLRAPAEVAVDKAVEQINTLNAALRQGTAAASDYDAAVGRVVSAAFTAAPTFGGLAPEVGGIDSEQFRLDQAAQQLDAWYQDQLSRLAVFRAQKRELSTQWDAQEQRLQAEHQAKLGQLATAQSQLTLTRLENSFAAMAATARNAAGEQSIAYRALFAISKGFAAAEATLALGRALSDAMAQPWPWSMARTADVLAQFANITGIIASATLGFAEGGRIRGPGTSTSDSIPIRASDGEFMVRARSASEPGAPLFLDDFNRRGMAALDDWRGYADGGAIAAAPEPRMQLPDGPSIQNVNKNNMKFLLVDDPTRIADAMRGPAGEAVYLMHLSRNPEKVRQILKL
jgi:phage-related minor tail protein